MRYAHAPQIYRHFMETFPRRISFFVLGTACSYAMGRDISATATLALASHRRQGGVYATDRTSCFGWKFALSSRRSLSHGAPRRSDARSQRNSPAST